MSKVIAAFALLLCAVFIGPQASAEDSQRIASLEARVLKLEKRVTNLKSSQTQAKKYLKCVRKVDGNVFVVPFKMLDCVRK